MFGFLDIDIEEGGNVPAVDRVCSVRGGTAPDVQPETSRLAELKNRLAELKHRFNSGREFLPPAPGA